MPADRISPDQISPGLCSITFRSLRVDEVLALSVEAGLEGIEWGSDVHVPPGGPAAAESLRRRSEDAGVAVASYGSYLGSSPGASLEDEAVDAVLDTAEALGAPIVRMWTAFGVTPGSPAADRARVAERTAALVDSIASRGMLAALEFHPGTLTHTAASALELVDGLGRPALRSHWQPDPSLSPEVALAELEAIAPHLAHLHVFSWGPTGIDDRRGLAEGAALWSEALALARRSAGPLGVRRFALLEYVRGDDPAQLVADAQQLNRLLQNP